MWKRKVNLKENCLSLSLSLSLFDLTNINLTHRHLEEGVCPNEVYSDFGFDSMNIETWAGFLFFVFFFFLFSQFFFFFIIITIIIIHQQIVIIQTDLRLCHKQICSDWLLFSLFSFLPHFYIGCNTYIWLDYYYYSTEK